MSRPLLLDLPHGHQAMVDDADAALIAGKTFYRGSNGYVYYSLWEDGRSFPRTLHALLMGEHPEKHIDHRNGDKLDNRRANLRVVTPSQNQVNRKRPNRNNSSGVRGVHWREDMQKWIVQITFERKNRYLGSYADLEQARRVRREAELRYFGEECP